MSKIKKFNQSNHTPGPWSVRVFPKSISGNIPQCYGVCTNDMQLLPSAGDEGLANAMIQSAALELLRAAQEALTSLESLHEQPLEGGGYIDNSDEIALLKSAINKALG